MKDWRGVELEVGQQVIYAVASGSSSSKMTLGRIVRLVPRAEGAQRWDPPARVEVHRVEGMGHRGPKSTVLVQAERVTVILGVPELEEK